MSAAPLGCSGLKRGPQTPLLRTIYIYVNEECNLACRHCWLSPRFSKAVIGSPPSYEQYVAALTEAQSLGLQRFRVTGGEPLLRKDLVLDLLCFGASAHIQTQLETNGTLVDERVADVIASTRTRVAISLDGPNAEIHEGIRQVRGAFSSTIDALKMLYSRHADVKVIVSLYRSNIAQWPAIARLLSELAGPAAVRMKLNPIVEMGRGQAMFNNGECLSARELLAFVREPAVIDAQACGVITVACEPAFYPLDAVVQNHPGGGRCGLRRLLAILANGSLSLCGMGYRAPAFVFGRLGATKLADLWKSDADLLALREAIPCDLEGICGNCMFQTTCCGGCRALSYSVYGSMTAPAPRCQALYDEGLFPVSRMVCEHRNSGYEGGAHARHAQS